VASAGGYVLHWYENTGESGGLTTSPYSVAILDGAAQTMASGTFDAYHAKAWGAQSLLMSLAPGTYTLHYTAQGVQGGLDTLLDNVTLAPVPEASTLAMFSLGAAALLLRVRRRLQGGSPC
jgi:hypothetical protein